MLASGELKISDLSLLIFDEAHHAVGNSPYVTIMNYYHNSCDPKLRPKVFSHFLFLLLLLF